MPEPSNSEPDRRRAWAIGSLLDEEPVVLAPHERSPVAGSPATPVHGHAIRLAYILVALLIGITAGLGNAVVAVNAVQLQRLLDLGASHVAWLTTSYVMTAASANLLLIKLRQQHGLRRFAMLSIGLYAALTIAHLFVTSFAGSILLRAITGFVAISLMPLCVFNMMQGFPAKWRLKGLVVAIGVTQCAVPLAYVLSPSLLQSQGWRSLLLLEAGLALLSFAAMGALRLPPADRARVFEWTDLLTYILVGGGLALAAAVLGLGRWVGWLTSPWVVASVVIAGTALLIGIRIEAWRATPLLNLRWLASGDIARFAIAIFLIRLVLAEQDVALVAARALGATSHQLTLLTLAMLSGAVTGVVASAISINIERVARPMMLAVGVVAISTTLVSVADGLEHMPHFYLGQAAIAFAGTFFVGPALLLGITSALQRGNTELISFIALFAILNAFGALAGQALLGTFSDWRRADGSDAISASMETLGFAAFLAGLTTIYLAVLLGMRIRRKLIELREKIATRTSDQPVQMDAAPQLPDSNWHPPFPHPALAAAYMLLGAAGLALVLAAWDAPAVLAGHWLRPPG